MNDNFNEAAETAAEAEARKRAERIAAIRRSVRSSAEETAAKNALSAAEAALNGGTSPDDAVKQDWEDDFASRIAQRVQKVKQQKVSTAEQILKELEEDSYSAPPAEYSSPRTVEDILKELDGYKGIEVSDEPAYEVTENEPEPEISQYEPVGDDTAEPVEESVYEEAEAFTEPESSSYEPVEEPVYEAVDPEEELVSDTAEPEYEQADDIPDTAEPVEEPAYEEEKPEEMPDTPAVPPVRAVKPLRKLSRIDSNQPVTKAVPEAPVVAAAEDAAEPENISPKKKKKKKKKKKTFKERLLGFFPQKQDSILERIRKVIFLCAIAVIIVCGYIVGDYYLDLWRSKRENRKNMNAYWDVMDDEPQEHDDTPDDRKVYRLLSGAKRLLEENSEVVGVIRIEGTPVNNPVLQADDNSKYIKHKLSGRESRAGEIFLDYRNHFDEVDENGHLMYENSDNLVIYGHNMLDEEMFGSLKYYDWYDSYYGEHPVIDLNSNYEQYKYKIFAFFILDADDETETKFDCWNRLDFVSEEDFYDFVNEAKKRTLRLNDVDVKYGDKLLTLSTCNTVLGDRGRLIILARLVRDGEDPKEGTQNSTENPNIKWPSVYYNYKGSAKRYDPEAEFVPYGPSEDEKQKVSGEKK